MFLASFSATAPSVKSIVVGVVSAPPDVAVPEVLVVEVALVVVDVVVVPAFRADLVSAFASLDSTFVAAAGAFVREALVALVAYGAFVVAGDTLGAFSAVVVFVTFGAFVEAALAGDGPFGPFDAASSEPSTKLRTIAVPVAIFTKRMRITSLGQWAIRVPIGAPLAKWRKSSRFSALLQRQNRDSRYVH